MTSGAIPHLAEVTVVRPRTLNVPSLGALSIAQIAVFCTHILFSICVSMPFETAGEVLHTIVTRFPSNASVRISTTLNDTSIVDDQFLDIFYLPVFCILAASQRNKNRFAMMTNAF